jgi:hypothetical protein
VYIDPRQSYTGTVLICTYPDPHIYLNTYVYEIAVMPDMDVRGKETLKRHGKSKIKRLAV